MINFVDGRVRYCPDQRREIAARDAKYTGLTLQDIIDFQPPTSRSKSFKVGTGGPLVDETVAEVVTTPEPAESTGLVLELDPRVTGPALRSDAFLPLVLDETLVVDLVDATHVLVAGETGAGKSVALHAMIQGLIAADRADIWLIDPKMVEAAAYRGAVDRVVFRDGAEDTLSDAVTEMERRYTKLLALGLRKWKGRRLVVVVDEYSDLTLGGAEVELQLIRLAQMGRAAGIHLILSTQRPDANVITPIIRANMPTTLALRVSTAINSRVIRGDAEAYTALRSEPVGTGIWSQGNRLVRPPFVDPYARQEAS
jgi:hypothetical protein